MQTIILKWNPSFSSYTILRFLKALQRASEANEAERKSNWSVWDHDKVKEGDRFYMLKVGYGQTGIVARGTITSKAELGEDWSYNDRPRYYVDYVPEIMINPDAFQLLTSEELSKKMPDFEWFGGHSGIVLSDEYADTLEEMWEEYMTSQSEAFDKASDDNLFIALTPDETEGEYKIAFSRDYDDDLWVKIAEERPHFDKIMRREIATYDSGRLMWKFKTGSKRVLAKRLRETYPTVNDLPRLCSDLYEYGIGYKIMVNLVTPDENDEDPEEED